MAKTKQQKQDTVAILADKLAKSRSVALADYRGLTMGQLSTLRDELQKNGAELAVVKNTLLALAAKKQGLKVDETQMQGPTAALFAYEDEVAPIKALTRAITDFQIGTIKGGYLNGGLIDAGRLKTLAGLPSANELRAKVVGVLGGPLYGVVGVLQANLRNLVYVLDQIRIVKGGD